jgi:hypothetical protein
MYILFKATSSDKLGIVQQIGRVLHLAVGYIPDTHVDIAEYNHLNPVVLPEAVALAWKFFAVPRAYINVRPGTLQNEQLQIISSGETEQQKVKYYLTDEDKANAAEFMKACMRYILDDTYNKRFIQEKLYVTELESSTWAQQEAEAKAYLADSSVSVPMLTVLADNRSITVAEIANKVVNAVNAYNTKITIMLGKKQKVETEIKACQSNADCNRLMHMRFDVTMPYTQKEEEGITEGSKLDL